MDNQTILGAILDRVESCIREMVIPNVGTNYIQKYGYDLIRIGKSNTGYKTPLRGCYRDLRDVEALDRQFRIPAVFLLLDTGFFRGNQDQTPFAQENYPLDAIVTKYPILLRTLLKKDTGQLAKVTVQDPGYDNYDYLTAEDWGMLELEEVENPHRSALDASYRDPQLSSAFRNKLRKVPITDQISNLLSDFDSLLNPYNLAGSQPNYPDGFGVLDAFITSVECLQGVLSPYEIVDYCLEVTFWQKKGYGPIFDGGTPVVS